VVRSAGWQPVDPDPSGQCRHGDAVWNRDVQLVEGLGDQAGKEDRPPQGAYRRCPQAAIIMFDIWRDGTHFQFKADAVVPHRQMMQAARAS